MASILRSGKFVRYFAGLTRSVMFESVRETERNFFQKTQCICGNLGQYSTSVKLDQTLERSIRRLDNDVRRIGRISRRDIEEVIEEIRTHKSATSSQSLLVIRCCGNLVPEELPEVRTALVQEIWKTLNTLKVPMDISHYNALLRVYLENEHPFSPTEFLADLESKGIDPNRVTYQRLIARYCQVGDIEGATRILEFMREKGLPVNENVFNALILGHSQANDMESATGILGVMKQAGLEPSADTYTTLLCCHAKRGNIEDLMEICTDIEKKEIYLLDKDFLDIAYTLTINGYGDKVDPILSKIRKSTGYNQDAVSTILKLVNKGFEDVGYKILKTMPRGTKSNGELNDTGNFFIKQMVKAQRPVEKIVQICKSMIQENLNSKALLTAAEASLESSEMLLPLLKELKENGFPIRQHYFWPLICSTNSNAIFDILKNMQNEFQLSPNSETIREYVIPHLKEKNFNTIITMLRSNGISTATASACAAFTALQKNNMKEAADIMQNYKAFYSPGLFRKPLISALGKTNDFDSYSKIVREIYDNMHRTENFNSSNKEEETIEAATEVDEEEKLENFKNIAARQANALGIIVMDALIYFKTNRVEYLTRILKDFVNQGLTISNYYAEIIQERLGSEMTSEISDLLGKLSSGDLEPAEIQKKSLSGNRFNDIPIQALEKMIENNETRGENVNNLKRMLLLNSIKHGDLQKTEDIIAKLEKENFPIGNGIYAILIDSYTEKGDLNKAVELFQQICSKLPDFSLDNLKIVKLAELMIKENKYDEAIDFLKKHKKEEMSSAEATFNYTTTCWRLLNHLAESGNVENLQKLFDTLIENNYIKINNVLLGPLIKVHLVRDDIKGAIEIFETICNKYKTTPWKNELACRLIQMEDATNLQRLTDLSTNIHGEVNSLYDLVFSFVECGRIRQARKILETPGLKSRPNRINSACERYQQEGMVQPLEGLVEATKDLNHIDRNNIFYNLLLSYCKEDQPEKALGLWTKMQEEDIAPNDQFLIKLGEYLKSKNLDIPFVVPSVTSENIVMKSSTKKPSQMTKPYNEKINSQHQNWKQALYSGDVDTAIKIKNERSYNELSLSDKSKMIELLCQSGRMNEANKCIEEMIENKQFPIVRIFKFYLNKLASSGDVSMMEKIGLAISNETKKLISFDNRYCHANIVSGKAEDYLNKLKNDIETAKTEQEIADVGDKFPRGGALGILEKHPELTEKFREVAECYAKKNINGPINVLWIDLFTQNKAEADEIWEKYLKGSSRLMFQRILYVARQNKDESLITKLIEKLKETQISEGALGTAYSTYLDILTGKEKYEFGLDTLKKKIIPDVCLENLNRSALNRLKVGLESTGKEFPYKIPEKSTLPVDDTSSSSSSSSSSSDDEQNKKSWQNK